MKIIGQYFVMGLGAAAGMVVLAELLSRLFNGLGSYGDSVIFSMLVLLCVLIVTCTGVVVSRLEQIRKKQAETSELPGE